VDHQAYGDRVRGGWHVALSVGLGNAGADTRAAGRGRGHDVLIDLEPGELDVKDIAARGDAGVLVLRAVRGVTLVRMGRAQLLDDEHEREAEEERQGDRRPVQRVGWPAAREGFDSPAGV